jgi:DNA-binding MarR family transcriptional regulator
MQRRTERISAVEAHLGYWLHYVGYRITHELRLKAQRYGVTAAEWIVLRVLADFENGAMPSHVAAQLGLTRSAISKLAARLEAKELIERRKSVTDHRAKLLTLTLFGRVLVPTLAALADQTDERNFGGAGQEPQETIESVMKWIVRRDEFRFVPPARKGGYGYGPPVASLPPSTGTLAPVM